MAHSFIEAFPSEIEAFRAFAKDHPERTTFLVDTYDTRRGVENAIRVIRELDLTGSLGVRLDSGDLAALARDTRQLLDDAGLPDVRIFASGNLDEYELERFVVEQAPIDAVGVGTRMGVSADAPSLDSAYKLVAFGDRPVLKLSAGKSTLPGAKQTWRRAPIGEDLLSLRDEPGPEGFEPLLTPMMRRGVRTAPPDTLTAARDRCARDLDALPGDATRLRDPVAPRVGLSGALRTLTDRLRSEITQG
jgi:nicotinate phosphoribosyltransferase